MSPTDSLLTSDLSATTIILSTVLYVPTVLTVLYYVPTLITLYLTYILTVLYVL